MKTVKRPQMSPLRYPGGKSALFGLVSEFVRRNHASGGTYVEPYAGGAGLALGLLLSEQVERVVINDLDPAIYSFWRAVTEHSESFMGQLASVELSVDEWHRQREVYLSADANDALRLGFATFYLNRTNRSGVLNAGVIGGQDQSGNYKMDARFNRDALLEKCRLISLYASRITVTNQDGRDTIVEHASQANTLTYADPPYYEKGSLLYLNAFDEQDHASLAELLNREAGGNWILTYDAHPAVEAMYQDRRRFDVEVYYSVRDVRRTAELLVVADSVDVPEGSVVAR
jgi:DNA adenine methylase